MNDLKRTVPPTIKYTTKELLEKIEQKVDALHDIRSRWGMLMAMLALVVGSVGLGSWWDYARIDALRSQNEGLRLLVVDLNAKLNAHMADETHGDVKCYTDEDDAQNARIQTIERRIRRR